MTTKRTKKKGTAGKAPAIGKGILAKASSPEYVRTEVGELELTQLYDVVAWICESLGVVVVLDGDDNVRLVAKEGYSE